MLLEALLVELVLCIFLIKVTGTSSLPNDFGDGWNIYQFLGKEGSINRFGFCRLPWSADIFLLVGFSFHIQPNGKVLNHSAALPYL